MPFFCLFFLLLFIFCFPRLFVFFCCCCSCVCRRCWTIEHQIMYFICFDFIHRLVFPKLFKSEVLPLDNGSESYLKRLSVTLRRSLKLWFFNLRLNTCNQRNSFSVIDLDSHVLKFVYSFLGSIKGISHKITLNNHSLKPVLIFSLSIESCPPINAATSLLYRFGDIALENSLAFILCFYRENTSSWQAVSGSCSSLSFVWTSRLEAFCTFWA